MRYLVATLLVLASPLSAIPETESLAYEPWFTGPMLSPTPINLDPAHPAIEPAITIFNTYGSYGSNWKMEKQDNIWSINPSIDFQFAITNNIGVETFVSFISNFQKGKSASYFQDSWLFLGYQVSTDVQGSWIPDFRVNLQQLFPTGSYQKLDPDKNGIDATGFGSFQTGPEIVARKMFYPSQGLLSIKGSIGYFFPLSVHVKGFNTYGGGYGTKGTVKPGQTLISFLALEYSICQRWVFAFDSEILFQRKSHFKGKRGLLASGQIPATELPPSLQISIAPQVEYNFSIQSGLLGGLWLTVAGRNSGAFASAFLAYVYVF